MSRVLHSTPALFAMAALLFVLAWADPDRWFQLIIATFGIILLISAVVTQLFRGTWPADDENSTS